MQGSQNKDPQCKHAEGPLPSGAIPADWAPCLCKSSQPLLFDPSALTHHHLPKPDGRSGHTIRGLIRQWLHDKSPLNVSFLKCHEDINKYVALLSRAQQLSSPWGRSLDQQRSPPAEGHAGKSWTYFISFNIIWNVSNGFCVFVAVTRYWWEAYSGAAGSKLHTFAVYLHEMEETKPNAKCE